MSETKTRNVVALFGEWNTTNLGDQAIGLRATQYYLNAGLTVKLFAMGSLIYLAEINEPSQVENLFEQLHKDACDQENERTSVSRGKVRWSSLTRKVLYVEQSLRFARNQHRWAMLKPHLHECCLIAVGGGDLLNMEYSPFLTPLHFITTFSKSAEVALVCLGCSSSISFSGLHERVVRDFIRQARIVSARDCTTQKLLANLGGKEITLFGDFALQMNFAEKKETSYSITLAVNVMKVPKKIEEIYSLMIRNLLQCLRDEKNFKIVLFTTGNIEDQEFAQQLLTKVGQSFAIIHPTSLLDLREFYGSVDLVVATRLHAAILAIDQQIPAVAISMSPKIKSFFMTIGLSDFSFDVSNESQRAMIDLIKSRDYNLILERFCSKEAMEVREGITNAIRVLTYQPALSSEVNS